MKTTPINTKQLAAIVNALNFAQTFIESNPNIVGQKKALAYVETAQDVKSDLLDAIAK